MRQAKDEKVIDALAAEIRARRSLLSLSQEELAHRADVHRTFVAKLELAKNQPSLSVLFRLANALEVDPEELVAGIVRRQRIVGRNDSGTRA